MRRTWFFALLVLGLHALPAAADSTRGKGLQIIYATNGVQQLIYDGALLEDLTANPSDTFRIGRISVSDLSGNILSDRQYDSPDANLNRTWDSLTQTWTYSFSWGTIAVRFAQSGDSLAVTTEIQNFANSGVVFKGASVSPFFLHFPGAATSSCERMLSSVNGPTVALVDFGSGEVASVIPDPAEPLRSGFKPVSTGAGCEFFVSILSPNDTPSFPASSQSVMPGQSESYMASLRFAPSGTNMETLASDAYSAWFQTWPDELQWPDRRFIGTVRLAESGGASSTDASNPRQYFRNTKESIDITTPAGLARFQSLVLAEADLTVQNLRTLNAQGAITWDVEGEQYRPPTSYVCEPDAIAQAAPEMETFITDPSSPYVGLKLDDAYFRTFTDAGFRVGLCVRPQHFTIYPDGTAAQLEIPDSQIASELIRKMQYAHNRWGATLFYLDSAINAKGESLEPGILKQVAANFPDSIIIPDKSTTRYYAYSAPSLSLASGTVGTATDVYRYYADAFSTIRIDTADASQFASLESQLIAAVSRGDILMGSTTALEEVGPDLPQIYQSGLAVSKTNSPEPVASQSIWRQPSLFGIQGAQQWSSPGISILSPAAGQIVAGTMTITAQPGTTSAGARHCVVIDGTEIRDLVFANGLYVADIDTNKLVNGQHELQISVLTPGMHTLLSDPLTFTVANWSQPAPQQGTSLSKTTYPFPISLTFPLNAQSLAGTINVTASIGHTLSSTGSYLMVDGVPNGPEQVANGSYSYALDSDTLRPGLHTLQIWAVSSNNEHLVSNPVQINIIR